MQTDLNNFSFNKVKPKRRSTGKSAIFGVRKNKVHHWFAGMLFWFFNAFMYSLGYKNINSVCNKFEHPGKSAAGNVDIILIA